MLNPCRWTAVTLLAWFAATALSQTPASQDRQNDQTYQLSVQTRVVSISALVHDKTGHPVLDLTPGDFSIFEDGKSRPIRYVDRDSDLPLRMGLLIDTSGSEAGHLAEERRTTAAFFQAMLTRPEDQALLVQFDWNVLLLQGMTSNVAELQHALDELDKPHPARPNGGGTLLYDALCATTQRMTGAEDQRRALVVLTDGEDYGSKLSYGTVIRLAQLSHVAIYTIFYSDNDPGPPSGIARPMPVTGRETMQVISDATGGRFFAPSRSQPVAAIFSAIEAEMRSRYRIAYTPPPSPPMRYHAVELKTRDRKQTVQAQTAYFTPRQP